MMRTSLTYALVSFALLALPLSIADAASAVWNGTMPSLRYNYRHECTMQRSAGYAKCRDINQVITQGYVSVNYGVRVFELDGSGAKVRTLESGESVPAGTRVLFEFKPHEYEDVSWTGSGSINNTPFGTWKSSAAFPTGAICAPEYLYATFTKGRGLFSVLSVNPPTKNLNITGASNCTAASDGVSRICTLDTEGMVGATFSFEPTYGSFYSGFNHRSGYRKDATTQCEIWGKAAMFMDGQQQAGTDEREALASAPTNTTPYRVDVPAQTVPFSLVVGPAGDRPTTPTVNRTSPNPNNACVVGTTISLTMTSTDPGGKQVRYGIDWDASGTIDQYVPASGYVDSGVAQSAARTFSSTGPKTVRALAQNADGALSAWTTVQFTCADAANVTLDDTDGENAFTSGDGTGDPIIIQNPDLSLRALPSLVRPEDTTKIHWSATDVVEGSCTVTGNSNSWSGEQSPPGGETSNPITGGVVYTLACTDLYGNALVESVSVGILPLWSEPRR